MELRLADSMEDEKLGGLWLSPGVAMSWSGIGGFAIMSLGLDGIDRLYLRVVLNSTFSTMKMGRSQRCFQSVLVTR